jgi:two-component system, NtrC family, sensor histidine kinase PilS
MQVIQSFLSSGDASKIRRLKLLSWSRLVLAALVFTVLMINFNMVRDGREMGTVLTPVTVSALYVLVALTGLWVLHYSKMPWRGQLFAQTLSDVVIITLLVLSLGSSGGGYVILYIMPIALSASLLGWGASFLICSVAVLALVADGARCSYFLAQQVNWLLIAVQAMVSYAIMALLRWAAIHENAREKQYRHERTQTLLLQEVRDQHLVEESIGWLVLNELGQVQLFNTPARTLAWQANVILEVGLTITADSPLATWLAAAQQLGDTYLPWPPASAAPAAAALGDANANREVRALATGGKDAGAAKNAPAPPPIAVNTDQLLLHSSSLPHMANYKALTLELQSDRDAKAQQQQLAAIGRLSSSIAHEIRNPLAAISQAAQLLQENASLPAQDAPLLAMVLANTQRIERIVTNVLGWSRGANAHPSRFSPAAQLSLLLPDLLTGLQLPADRVQWQSNDNPDPEVLFDTDHLYQILSNLLGNAARYASTHSGGIRLQLRQRGAFLALLVLDDGQAVDDTVRAHLFEPFASASKNGTGLGLFLCHEYARANKGSLELMTAREALAGAEHGAENWVLAPYTKAFVLNMPIA